MFRKEPLVISKTDLADWLTMTTQGVTRLEKIGVIHKIEKGKYDAKKCMQQYIEYLRTTTRMGSPLELKLERAHKTKIEREIKEIELAELQGDLIRRGKVEKQAYETGRMVRDSVLAVPSKISNALDKADAATIRKTYEDELTDALRSIS